jgi:hypothetical protein
LLLPSAYGFIKGLERANRERGVGTDKGTGDWMRAFSEVLVSPPVVEILRVAEGKQAS